MMVHHSHAFEDDSGFLSEPSTPRKIEAEKSVASGGQESNVNLIVNYLPSVCSTRILLSGHKMFRR